MSGDARRPVLSRPWFAAVAIVVALSLVVAAGVVALVRFGSPFDAPLSQAERAPSAFPLSLTPVSSPAVDRGGTIAVEIAGQSPQPIELVELWDGDRLVLSIHDLESTEIADGSFVLLLELDHVPTVAGDRPLLARAITASGEAASSAVLPTSVLDLPVDLGLQSQLVAGLDAPPPVTRLRAAPGDTLESIAGRLAVAPSELLPSVRVASVDETLPTGTPVMAPVAAVSIADDPTQYRLPPSDWLTRITAALDGCDVVVTATNPDEELWIYGGPEQRKLGEARPGEPARLSGLPVGLLTLVAFLPRVTDDVSGINGPSLPVSITVPEECADLGWSGDAIIVNGALSASIDVPDPYLYVSIDRGPWQRVPAAEGQFLPSSVAADLRSFLSVEQSDQVDLELWHRDGTEAVQVGAGLFCRASIQPPTTAGSTASGGPCQPVGATAPGTAAPARGLTLTASLEGGSGAGAYLSILTDPLAEQQVNLAVDAPVTLTIESRDPALRTALVQVSMSPISSASTGLPTPGVLRTITVPLTPSAAGSSGTTTIRPWQWRSLKVDDDGGLLDDAGSLVLDDAVAASLAAAALAANDGLVTDLAVRALAVADQNGTGSEGYASRSVAIDMTTTEPWTDETAPQLVDPLVEFRPGIAQSATNQAYQGACFDIQSYPPADVWLAEPWSGPLATTPAGTVYPGAPEPGDTVYSGGDAARSDLALAQISYPTDEWIYCEEARTDFRNSAVVAIYAAEQDAKPKCGFVCVLQTTLMGAFVGFLVGGPAGALVGASIGLGAGLVSTVSPGVYEALTELWDTVAGIYNAIYTTAIDVLDALNPVCLAAGAASDQAEQACDAVTNLAVAVAFTYATGLPPQLPMHENIAAVASGDMTALLVVAMDYGLAQFGLSCDTFTVPADTADTVTAVAELYGDPDVDATLGSATAPDGSLSACQAFASVLYATVRRGLETEQGKLISSAYRVGYIPGLVYRPVGDSPPTIVVTGGVPGALPSGTNCPVTANTTLVMNGRAYELAPAIEQAVVRRAAGYEQVAGITSVWAATVPLPALPDWDFASGPPAPLVRSISQSAPNAPYLTVQVDSPCFGETVTFTRARFGSGPLAFTTDARGVAYYYPQHGLTDTP
ncbi:MAG: hypothetical protein ACK4HH_04585 [Microcella sp.]